MVKETNESKKENEMTNWQSIQETENTIDDRWAGFSVAELKQLRKEFKQDLRDARRYGSHLDAVSLEQDITEIESILCYKLSFPRWAYLVDGS